MDTAYKTTLELDKVLNRAVQLCACQETKEMMQALEPAPTVEDERYDLAQTNAINALLIKNGSPRFGSVHEVRRIVAHARKGGILSMGELLEIAATLRNFSGLSQWYGLSEHEMLPTDDLFFALAPQPVLEKQISESIISPEEMADTASVTLHDLRRKIRQTEDSIRTKLDNIIRNSTTNKFLQDAVVSLRNGRYVVPVRAEYRGEVGGVIHDVSSTGATVFVEPTAVVEANARIMQLRAQEQEEITRILTSFSTQVGSLEPQFSYSYDAMLKIDLLLANVCKQNVTRFPYEIVRLAEDVAGGLMVTMPSQKDFHSETVVGRSGETIGEICNKYFKTKADVSTEDRQRVLRFLENMCLGAAAVGYRTESMHGAGSPQAQRIMIARQGNIQAKKQLAKDIAGIQ